MNHTTARHGRSRMRPAAAVGAVLGFLLAASGASAQSPEKFEQVVPQKR
jgi:hypothetical protein